MTDIRTHQPNPQTDQTDSVQSQSCDVPEKCFDHFENGAIGALNIEHKEMQDEQMFIILIFVTSPAWLDNMWLSRHY